MAEQKSSMVSASMVELKAELYRKQEEFRNQKAVSSGYVRAKTADKGEKKSLWSKKNNGVSERAAKDEVKQSAEEEDALLKSRRILEQKAKLYQRITTSSDIPEEDGSDYYLVDFQKKAIDALVDDRERRRQREEEKEEEAERRALDEAVPPPSTPDEEWVDFTDSLGRSRRCMRKDLDALKRRDEELARGQAGKSTLTSAPDSSAIAEGATLMSEDMHKEKMRLKWEEETETLMGQEHGQTHYSNVRFDEIRNHGVGFYQFSKDHEIREEQLENLKKMREETMGERSRQEKVKDKRKAMMEARLAKVRQRRKLKPGTSGEETKNEETVDGPSEQPGSHPVSEGESNEAKNTEKMAVNEAEAAEKRKMHVRDWDKGKQNDPSNWGHKNYVEGRRDEREAEFAPPSAYFADSGRQKSAQGRSQSNPIDQMRARRLQKSMTGVNSNFAPPASYGRDTAPPSKSRGGLLSSANATIGSVQPPVKEIPVTDNLDSIPLPPSQKKTCSAAITKGDGGSSSVTKPRQVDLNTSSNHLTRALELSQSSNSQTSSVHPSPQPGPSSPPLDQTSSYSQSQFPSGLPQHLPGVYPSSDANSAFPYVHGAAETPSLLYQTYSHSQNPNAEVNAVSTYQGFPSNSFSAHATTQDSSSGHAPLYPNQAAYPTYAYPDITSASASNVTGISQQTAGGGYAPQYPSQTPHFSNYPSYPCNAPIASQQHTASTEETVPQNSDPSSYFAESLKRPHAQEQPPTTSEVKKSKVPKSFFVDTRFVQNENESNDEMTATDQSVSAVPYTFGSFTAARQAVSDQYEDTVALSRDKNQISGGPMLYTEEQQQQQLKQQEEEEAALKVTEFLDSFK
ncbi:coiled-coil domain-containing protein 174 isoform X1 [Aplysia californica]|uniref:Coiled-coil domain-containing protein 174 isoform X1 n=1 Tax=Aplysia californica TaxID=6500 RepID=A0ABM0JM20_APLCA|nr:coiled-coil domain-containing protein 174 isoform X1 [Aplysia californica]XP_005096857.1 coiled-coil domain-containing protein 174 isoform X1 [Aplysia californica]